MLKLQTTGKIELLIKTMDLLLICVIIAESRGLHFERVFLGFLSYSFDLANVIGLGLDLLEMLRIMETWMEMWLELGLEMYFKVLGWKM